MIQAINALKKYLATRRNPKPEELLFTLQDGSNKEINLKNISRAFRFADEKVQKNQFLTPIQAKPNRITLYDLVKFYRKKAKHYLIERKKETTPKDEELIRRLYEQKALPFLEIETPTKTDLIILRKQHKQLKEQIDEIEKKLKDEFDDWIEENSDENAEEEYQAHLKWEQEHPEEVKQNEEIADRAAAEWTNIVQSIPKLKSTSRKCMWNTSSNGLLN